MLNQLRGVAALSVVWFHCGASLPSPVTFGGFRAVDFFFLMSGFVLARAYEARLQAGLGPWSFFTRRLKRLYPLCLVGLLAGVLAWLAVYPIEGPIAPLPATVLFGLLLLPLPFANAMGQSFPIDGPLWSLFCELVANATYAFGIKRLSNLVLSAVTAVGASACILTFFIHGSLNAGSATGAVWCGLARVGFSFPLGVLLYRVHAAGLTRALAGASPVLLATVFLVTTLPPQLPMPLDAVEEGLCLLLVYPALLCAAAQAVVPSRYGARLGRLSYPLYATHVPLFTVAEGCARQAGLREGAALALYGCVALIAVAVAWGLGCWLEPSTERRMKTAAGPMAAGGAAHAPTLAAV